MFRRFLSSALAIRLFFIALVLGLALTRMSWPVMAMDPREHIEEIGRAIDSADAQIFAELVDMDALLNNALNVFVEEASRPENARRIPPMIALILPQLRLEGPSPVKDLLLGEAKNFVLAGISSGAFAGRRSNISGGSSMLAPLFAQASMGRKEIRDIGEPRRTATGWLVPFVIYDHDNGYEYPVRALLEYRGTDLKVTGLENMRQLIYQIGEESAASQD